MRTLMHAVRVTILAALIAPASAQPAERGDSFADAEPRWWKGNLHTHTFWSDGNDFPEMVALWYADNGYNFLALSDHNIMSEGQKWLPRATIDQRSRGSAWPAYLERMGEHWIETRGPADAIEVRLKPLDEVRPLVEQRGRFIMIPAEEITGTADDASTVHMNATNLAELIMPAEGATAADVIRANMQAAIQQSERLGRPILVHLNHPNFQWGITAEDLASVVEERFFEVFNGHASVFNHGQGPRPSTEEIWDIANTIRLTKLDAPPLYAIGTDDSHTYHGHSPQSPQGRAWVMVRARFLTPETLIRAMEAGDFYASTGVTLDDIAFDGSRLDIRIRPEPGENYTTAFIGTRRGASIVGRPRLDADANPIKTTLDYSTDTAPQIGEVFATVEGLDPSYELTGDELYVRAVVTSDAPPDVPSRESTRKRAWVQPHVAAH